YASTTLREKYDPRGEGGALPSSPPQLRGPPTLPNARQPKRDHHRRHQVRKRPKHPHHHRAQHLVIQHRNPERIRMLHIVAINRPLAERQKRRQHRHHHIAQRQVDQHPPIIGTLLRRPWTHDVPPEQQRRE